jgi:very-short-patch-repair endonuclease
MNDVQLLQLAAQQDRCIAARQLLALDYDDEAAARRDWLIPVFDGVYVAGPVDGQPRTMWRAATLTTPDTALARESAAMAYGFWDRAVPHITVVRPGNGGPMLLDGLRVYRSATLEGDLTDLGGIPITTPERTIMDLAGQRGTHPSTTSRMVRDAIRLELTSVDALFALLRRHRGERGVARLNVAASRYAGIPIRRTKSDAEALALTILHEHGLAPDAVNIRVEGEEGDLIYFDRRLIIELDGPRFHLDKAHDRRKQRHWERRRWTVRRVPTDDVYLHPDRLLRAAERQ